MRKFLLIPLLFLLASAVDSNAQQTEKMYLSGKGNDSMVEWDFFCTAGRNSGVWSKIGVPSNWELQGFGQFNYGQNRDKEEWFEESGKYRYTFVVPKEWKGKQVSIVFGGVSVDTSVRINGKSAGEKHQGGYYQFSYDITALVKVGKENLLEVDVDKKSSDPSVTRAERGRSDFWCFAGIFRPVWLEAKPKANIERIALNAKADGHFCADVYLKGKTDGAVLKGQIYDMKGVAFGKPFEAVCSGDMTRLKSDFDSPALWNAEQPNLYNVEISLVKDGQTIHTVTERFGFRTVELRPEDGLYVNGTKIHLKGVDRHSFWPTSGRTLNDKINLDDALIIKEMNMNVVRMSHYPPDSRFLDMCDSLGLYVLDELTGWQANYDTPVGTKLVKELVVRDVNHPSIIFWDNGNEGGFNRDLIPEYGRWDPQNRTVIHPHQTEEVISTAHYKNWWWVDNFLAGTHKLFLPTESLHGLYDGGHGAGLEEYWNRIIAAPTGIGTVLWDFSDQGVARVDLDGHLDTNGSYGADGILGPYREKEGSFFTIKDIWSPVQLKCGDWLPKSFDGNITVENHYSFTNLSECKFSATLERFDFIAGKSEKKTLAIASPDVEPGFSGRLSIPVTTDFASWDAMTISAYGPDGKELYSWTKEISRAEEFAKLMLKEDSNDCTAIMDNGKLMGLKAGENVLPLTNCRYTVGDKEVGRMNEINITNCENGWAEVSYLFNGNAKCDNIGVTFDFPEDKIKGMRWIGGGPYRVWKNRMRGAEFGLWQKDYNDTMTGETWDYPEFKGYHSKMYVADIDTEYGILRIVFASDNLFLHMLTPKSSNKNTIGVFPEGQISVLNSISAVGTKFTVSADSGPQSLPSPGPDYILFDKTPYGHFYMKFIPR